MFFSKWIIILRSGRRWGNGEPNFLHVEKEGKGHLKIKDGEIVTPSAHSYGYLLYHNNRGAKFSNPEVLNSAWGITTENQAFIRRLGTLSFCYTNCRNVLLHHTPRDIPFVSTGPSVEDVAQFDGVPQSWGWPRFGLLARLGFPTCFSATEIMALLSLRMRRLRCISCACISFSHFSMLTANAIIKKYLCVWKWLQGHDLERFLSSFLPFMKHLRGLH